MLLRSCERNAGMEHVADTFMGEHETMKLHDECTEALWQRYLKTRDVSTRNELVTRYVSLVNQQASRLSRRFSVQATTDEIASAGFDGLMGAVEMFDPNRHVKFETYATMRIVGAVHEWLRSVDPQRRGVRDFQKRREAALTVASSDAGARASAPQIAERMGMTPEQYEAYVRRVRSGVVTSLSAPDDDGDRNGRAKRDEIPDRRQTPPQEGVEREMVRDFITRGLRRQERCVLLLYYYGGLTMGEAGKVMGLSESRVSQIHKRVLAALRKRFGRRRQLCAVV